MGTNITSDIINKIFRKPDIQFGLSEFGKIKSSTTLTIFEKERGKFYLKCLKRNIDLLVWNEEKQIGEPEEIVRQLWLYKLAKFYNYSLARIAVEKSVNFGREVSEKAFLLYETYGFPLKLTEEIASERGQKIDKEEFKKEFEKHKELSRTSSSDMFKAK